MVVVVRHEDAVESPSVRPDLGVGCIHSERVHIYHSLHVVAGSTELRRQRSLGILVEQKAKPHPLSLAHVPGPVTTFGSSLASSSRRSRPSRIAAISSGCSWKYASAR